MTRAIADAVVLLRRELLRYKRDRAYWVGQIAFPVVVVAFIGSGLNSSTSLATGTDYISHLGSGVLMLLVGSGAVGSGFALIQDRETGFLRALLVAPVARVSIVAGKLAARLLVSLVLVLVLTVLLALVANVRVPHPMAAAFAILAVTVFFAALGIALATRLRRAEAFRMLAALVTVPLYLFSGIFYTLGDLPTPLRLLAYANPLAYGVDLFRFGLLGVSEIPVGVSAVVLVLLTAFSIWGAVALFERSDSA